MAEAASAASLSSGFTVGLWATVRFACMSYVRAFFSSGPSSKGGKDTVCISSPSMVNLMLYGMSTSVDTAARALTKELLLPELIVLLMI